MTTAATVVVTSRSFGSGRQDPVALLKERGLQVVRGPADHDPDALRPLLADAVAWIAGAGPVTDAHLAAAPHLQLIARYGTGTDAVNLDAARRRGLTVTNTPGANATAVAEHTVALTLACLRHLVDGDREVRAGRWPAKRGRELGALTVGVVGLGQIGRQVARLVRGFGAAVVAHDPYANPAADAEAVALDELLRRCDVVTLHRPPADRPVVDAAALGAMRRGAVLVNTARAVLVDPVAVAEALTDGRLGAYGTDVLDGDTAGAAALLDAPNTVVTPHCAAQTDEAIDRMAMTAAAEVVRVVIERQSPRHPVTTEGG